MILDLRGKSQKKESGDFCTSGALAHVPDVNASSLLHLHNLSLPLYTMLKLVTPISPDFQHCTGWGGGTATRFEKDANA